MSPPREHPGSDSPYNDEARAAQLRALLVRQPDAAPTEPSRADAGRTVPEVSAEDLLGLLGGTVGAPEGPPTAPTSPPARPMVGTNLPALLEDTDDDEIDLAELVRPTRLRHRHQRRKYGVAPFVRPSARRSRRKRRRDYRRSGFVELTPEKLRLRHRILPRTVLGTSVLLCALGLGMAVSGAAFYAYYDWRVTESEAKVKEFSEGFPAQYEGAVEQLQVERNAAIEELRKSSAPLQEMVADSNAIATLPTQVGGGVWFLRTLDTAGRPSIGSAFVVSADATSSYLVTSFQVVAAGVARPGPQITIEKNGEVAPAELWSWDPDRDLALIRTTRGGLPALAWAPEETRAALTGTRVYAVSGAGGANGALATPGLALDQSQAGIRHDTALGTEFRGGPLVNAKGEVVGVASAAFRPTGLDPGALPYAPPIAFACVKVLVCPGSVAASAPGAATAVVPARTGG